MSIVVILAEFKAKEGKRDELLKHVHALRVHANDKSKEPGTLVYYTNQDPDDLNRFIHYEEYESAEAHKFHEAQAPFKALVKDLDELIDGPLSIRKLIKV